MKLVAFGKWHLSLKTADCGGEYPACMEPQEEKATVAMESARETGGELEGKVKTRGIIGRRIGAKEGPGKL